MPSFEIPEGPATVDLKDDVVNAQPVRTGTATFSVTNKTGQPLAGRLSVQPQGDAKADWFAIAGDPERNFAASGTQKITVNLKTPATVTMGDYKFRFRVVNVNDPDNDYTDSAVVMFKVAASPPAQKKASPPWIPIVAAVALVLVVGGVVTFLVSHRAGKIAVPDVIGKPFADAEKAIKDVGLVAAQTDDTSPGNAPGTVVHEDPDKGMEVDEGTKVSLAVAKGASVPDVRNKPIDAARQQLIDSGFKVAAPKEGVAGGAEPNTVIAQEPEQGSLAAAGATVMLTVDPGVTVPDVSSGRNLNFEAAYGKLHNVGLSIGGQTCSGLDGAQDGMLIGQNPPAGTALAKGKDVAITVAHTTCFNFASLSKAQMEGMFSAVKLETAGMKRHP